MYKNILLAIDGSQHSERAAEQALQLASLVQEAKVEIIYVLDYSKAKTEVLHSESSEALDNERRKKLEAVEQKFQSIRVDYEIIMKHGDPGPTIVSYANDHHFDILIIGSRGLNSLQEMVLGSVSHKVAKRAKCPVMIVK